MLIDRVGSILRGVEAGRFVKVVDDRGGTGGFYILIADDRDFSGAGFDWWVEAAEELDVFAHQAGWLIEWGEVSSPPPWAKPRLP